MKTRKYYWDLLKILSIWLVLYVHTGSKAMYMYVNTNGISHWSSFVLRLLASVGPTLFFTISGGLLLEKEEDIKGLFKHRILRYLIIIVVFSLFQRIYWAVTDSGLSSFSFSDTMKTMYSQSVITQYWFLYSYLEMLIMLPFIRYIASGLTEKTGMYLMGIFIVFEGLLPIFEIIFDFNHINLSISMLNMVIFCPLMGYMIEYPLAQWGKGKNRFIIYGISILSFCINIVYTHHTFINSGEYVDIPCTQPLMALGIIVLFKNLFEGKAYSERTRKIICTCGSGVICIFLLEPQLRYWFEFIYDKLAPIITWFPATVIWLSVATFVGIIISSILRKIPIVNKLV